MYNFVNFILSGQGWLKNTIRLNARREWSVNVVNVTIEAMTCLKKNDMNEETFTAKI